MSDPFHEPKITLDALRRELTAVNSLGAAIVPAALSACEQAIGVLCEAATEQPFPYQRHTRHKPGQWITALGVNRFYSPETQRFLTALDGYALDKVRYPSETAHRQYMNAPLERANEIVDGTARFIEESEKLFSSSPFLFQLRSATKLGP